MQVLLVFLMHFSKTAYNFLFLRYPCYLQHFVTTKTLKFSMRRRRYIHQGEFSIVVIECVDV
jgi:hypothetical protein